MKTQATRHSCEGLSWSDCLKHKDLPWIWWHLLVAAGIRRQRRKLGFACLPSPCWQVHLSFRCSVPLPTLEATPSTFSLRLKTSRSPGILQAFSAKLEWPRHPASWTNIYSISYVSVENLDLIQVPGTHNGRTVLKKLKNWISTCKGMKLDLDLTLSDTNT